LGYSYLDEIERVTATKYFPTDADVLKARLKTTGVIEHSFTLKANHDPRMMQWKIIDVGGERSLRHAWAPYFEEVNAIIVLAPISAFDQVLAEVRVMCAHRSYLYHRTDGWGCWP
jgi:guanine nucleotide-binding protein alpha-1 subunit